MGFCKKAKQALKNTIVYICGFILHKNRSVVLIGSWMGEKFADNSRYLYQYLVYHGINYGVKQVVWATRSQTVYSELTKMGYKCVLIGSKESFYWHCKAGIHVICNAIGGAGDHQGDIDTTLSAGSKKVQLWHGNGIKCVPGSFPQSGKLKYLVKKLISNGGWVVGNYYFLCKNDLDVTFFKRKFGTDKLMCIDGAYPRTCHCEEYTQREENIISTLKKYNKVVMYLPTFRDKYDCFIHPLTNSHVLDYITEENILWIEKPHSVDKNSSSVSEIQSDNIISLESTFDINVLMPLIDVLITDYSSAMLDALYFRKQIVYYVPDYQYYIKDDRGFLMDYDSVCINPKVEDVQDFVNSLDKAIHTVSYNSESEKIRKLFWKYDDWTCGDIWNAIMQKIKK